MTFQWTPGTKELNTWELRYLVHKCFQKQRRLMETVHNWGKIHRAQNKKYRRVPGIFIRVTVLFCCFLLFFLLGACHSTKNKTQYMHSVIVLKFKFSVSSTQCCFQTFWYSLNGIGIQKYLLKNRFFQYYCDLHFT